MVSEEMIEAGVKAAYDFDLEIQPHADAVRAIYLAMLAASPIEDGLDKLCQKLERRETTASKYGGFDLINPDGPAAADRIEAQSHTIRVMREALERIANTPCFGFYGGFRKSLVAIARSALGASGE